MMELSLLTLLNTMAPVYCEYRGQGYDHTKSALLAYSRMHEEYHPQKQYKMQLRMVLVFNKLQLPLR